MKIIHIDPRSEGKTNINFVRLLTSAFTIEPAQNPMHDSCYTPSDFSFVEVICMDYVQGYDLLFAYHDNSKRHYGCFFIGQCTE